MANPSYEPMKVYWLPTVADISAPTVAEIAAGTDLTPWAPVDTAQTAATRNRVAQAMLGEGFISEAKGTTGDSLTLRLMRHPSAATDDDAWELFAPGPSGFVLLSYSGAVAAATRVEVWPVDAFEPSMNPATENTKQSFTVEFATTSQPDKNAVVAA